MDNSQDKYAIINPYEVNQYHRMGYDFVAVFYEDGGSYNSGSHSISGSFMNNPINFNVPSQEHSSRIPKFLMIRNEASTVLFGKT